MGYRKYYLGVDIGSVSLAIVLLDEKFAVIHSSYSFHNGRIAENLQKELQSVNIKQVRATGCTSSASSILKHDIISDSRIAFITAARHLHPGLKALLIIGAEKFGLATFGERGEYLNYRSNTSCAAGTGNFLDQQSERLNLKNIQEFSDLAYSNRGNFPLIASRCAVFAKTDLIHAQQEGYTLREICDGLSYGLAKNIIDAVSLDNTKNPIIAAGGVALNKAVICHIEKLTGASVTVDHFAPLYGAIGAAMACAGLADAVIPVKKAVDLILSQSSKKAYFYPPLELKLSEYPDFTSDEHTWFESEFFPSMKPVEIDLYNLPEQNSAIDLFLGIDIGSTSTKAVLLNTCREVIAGFYTRTAGQPLQAVQVIFEAICDVAERRSLRLNIRGAGTTGSGRKFTGTILGADIMPDEITAHAKAACELDPETDTIIEIGGQDSKFTLMHDGMVTFSVMNNVCAAGTGSFIEEQAKKLECPLSEYSNRAEKAYAPLASDRCTVFMERDLNHYLAEGYSVNEILAAVLHATCENYLAKVATTAKIGSRIFFQGATAKNKSLVAAFEQKLGKPVRVSKYCHLTGAMGVALELCDRNKPSTSFRGLDLYKKTIPSGSEVCQLCTNHCKLKVAEVDGEVVAYGFLCGRDYNTKRYLPDKSLGFQLMRKRKEVFGIRTQRHIESPVIGIPAGLHLFEEVPFWRRLFELLKINTITSEDCQTVVKDGKNLCSAEFCTPMAAMHAHVDYLRKRADYVFLPVYLSDGGENGASNQYCYYTQYVPSVISVQKRFQPKEKILSPILKSAKGEFFAEIELHRMLRSIGIKDIGFLQVTRAWKKARQFIREREKRWRDIYTDETATCRDMHVMLLGRPYTVLSPGMNSHIPEIIEKHGIRTFYMDMLPRRQGKSSLNEELIKAFRWKFASRIMEAAETILETDSCYPILLTSFKCTPDSFVTEYFKEIFEARGKPYLILQLDEHDSSVGYETRIEAGIQTFLNHFGKHGKGNGLITEINKNREFFNWQFGKTVHLKNKTMLLPSCDPQVGPLLEAVLQNSGLDVRLIESTYESIKRSLSHNTGQCLPLNIIVQNAIDYMEVKKLDPSNTLLWIMKSTLSCNLSMFPQYMQKLLKDYGNGMERASVYPGDLMFYDISLQTAINAYLAYMIGGNIRKLGCMFRPYEKEKGRTNEVMRESFSLIREAFREGRPKEKILEYITGEFGKIETIRSERPKVAIFGDLYVRDNDLMNQGLVKIIEENGGEVITTPYSEYIKIIVEPFTSRAFQEGRYLDYARTKFLKSLIPIIEDNYAPYFNQLFGETKKEEKWELDRWLGKFGINLLHRGESFENILKIHQLIVQHPDIDLFIQTNPSYCCPSLVTEAMAPRIEELTGIPVVTIEYDGTNGFKNEDVIPYLRFRKIRGPVHNIS